MNQTTSSTVATFQRPPGASSLAFGGSFDGPADSSGSGTILRGATGRPESAVARAVSVDAGANWSSIVWLSGVVPATALRAASTHENAPVGLAHSGGVSALAKTSIQIA